MTGGWFGTSGECGPPAPARQPTTSPRRFTKRPVTITALRFTGGPESARAVQEFAAHRAVYDVDADACVIYTLEGAMTAQPGDWIIRGVKGELYPCKPDVFDLTYEEASSDE